MKKILAFTLSEVLLSMTIIGIIAALTIPALKRSTDSKEFLTGAQKAYATRAQTTTLLETENGPLQFWRWADDSTIAEMYVKKMNTVEDCKKAGGCFKDDYETYFLNGSGGTNYNQGSSYTFATADGMVWIYDKVGTYSRQTKKCSGSEGNYVKDACGVFRVDTNGSDEPNTVGVDLVCFQVRADGVYPCGGGEDTNDNDCTEDSSTVWGCSARMLRENKIDWY